MVYQQHCAVAFPRPSIPVGNECSHLRAVVLVAGVGSGARVDDKQPRFDVFGRASKFRSHRGNLPISVP